ncbi:MAG TPA: NACHT domain-containing protein, partial [Blastocatellia bacterium]|nr:NACHT domain-containing protein [Blastocatellia bacterium]
ELLGRIAELADVAERAPIVVGGKPGCGKSALLAKFALEYRETHPEVFVLAHFIGVSPGSTDLRRSLRRICLELAAHFEIDEEVPEDFRELCLALPRFLAGAAAHSRIVLILDALNQLEPSHHSHALDWLPPTPHPNVRLIVSTLEGDCLDALRDHAVKPVEVVVGPLNDEERQQIIRETLWTFRKRLDERAVNDQMSMLLRKRHSDTPLYLVVACEELRVFGEFERVTDRILAFPDEVAELFGQVLERLERDHGREIVESALTFLECSRYGLLETELLELLKRDEETQLPQAIWAAFYRSVKSFLRPPGESGEGLLDFFHRQMSKAVRTRYLSADDALQKSHRELAEFFCRKADPYGNRSWLGNYPRGLSQLPFHLFNAAMHTELFELARDEGFLRAQTEEFQDDPSLSLQTIQRAIEGAARDDDAGIIAEFVIAHARRVIQLRAESPLDTLRKGKLERAWELADSYEVERSAIWHLLLCWELKDDQRDEDARATLERLKKKQLPKLDYWEAALASNLLAEGFGVDPTACADIQRRLLVDRELTVARKLAERGDIALTSAAASALAASGNYYAAEALWKARRIRAKQLLDCADVRAARQIVDPIEDPEAKSDALLELAESVRQLGSAGLARDLIDEVRAVRQRPSIEVARAYAAIGDLPAARQEFTSTALERDRSSSWGCDALKEIAIAQAEAGFVDDAIETAQTIGRDNWYGAEALMEIGKVLSLAGEEARAKRVLRMAFTATEHVNYYPSHVRAEITSAQIEAEDLEGALYTAERIDDPKDRAGALARVAGAIGKRRGAGDAERIFSAARRAADQTQYLNDKIECYVEIASGYARIGDNAAVECALRDALEVTAADSISDSSTRVELISRAIFELCFGSDRAELIEQAYEVARAKTLPMYTDAALGALALEAGKAGDFELAHRIGASISTLSDSSVKFAARIAVLHAKAGDLETALKLVGRVTHEYDRGYAAIEIGDVQAAAGEPASHIRSTYALALTATKELAWGEGLPKVFEQIATTLVASREFEEALMTAAAIEDNYLLRDMVISCIAQGQATEGRFDEAMDSLKRITGNGRCQATKDVAVALAQAGNFARAFRLLERLDEPEGYLADTYTKIAAAQAEAGDHAGAK